MGKHAYLLMVHESTKTLSTLLECLDDERNDIFIHVDKKSKGFDFAQCESVVKRSRVIWAPRIRVAWGGIAR